MVGKTSQVNLGGSWYQSGTFLAELAICFTFVSHLLFDMGSEMIRVVGCRGGSRYVEEVLGFLVFGFWLQSF